jgi:hypothetical protein
MAVPSGNNDKKSTAGTAFTATTEGGTILGNTTTGDVITKALALKDNATEWSDGTKPRVLNDGLQGNKKPLTAGTFAYEAAGKYVIAASSTTLSGVASNKILITGQGETRRSIAQFEHMFGAKTVTAFRQGQFSWTNTTRAGASLAARINWLNVASGGMDTATAPTSMSAVNMYAPGGSARDGSGANAKHTDVAANPTRAIPGRLVMKANFITSELDPWTATEPGSDFYKYKPITGM